MQYYHIIFKDIIIGYNRPLNKSPFNAKIPKAKIVGIIGPNGCGKTTLLKTILHDVKPIKGEITFSFPKSEINKKIGYVPQRTYFDKKIPFFTFEIILQGLFTKKGFFKKITKEDKEEVIALAKILGIDKKLETPFGHLSGGEKQKVLIARALIKKPEMLLLDEPTSALDIKSKQNVLNILKEINKQLKITILIVSHNLNEIQELTEYCILMSSKEIMFGKTNEIITNENLSKLYGSKVKLINYHKKKYTLMSDNHVFRNN